MCTSIPCLEARIRDIAGTPDRVVLAGPNWTDDVVPGDGVVADHWTDRDELAIVGCRGAARLHVLSTGIDSLDLARLQYPELTCSRGITGGPIAELALAMLLARTKRLDALLAAKEVDAPLGELAGQTVGIVGYGAIGARVAMLASAFDMHVRVLRGRDLAIPGALGITQVDDIFTLVRDADHVVLAAPLTARTHRLIDARVLAAMVPDAHLVNVARGGLVDHEAVLAALHAGRSLWFTLDVTDPEPLPPGHPLLAHPRVTVTPHIAGRVAAAADRNWAVFADNVVRWRTGRALQGAIDRSQGY